MSVLISSMQLTDGSFSNHFKMKLAKTVFLLHQSNHNEAAYSFSLTLIWRKVQMWLFREENSNVVSWFVPAESIILHYFWAAFITDGSQGTSANRELHFTDHTSDLALIFTSLLFFILNKLTCHQNTILVLQDVLSDLWFIFLDFLLFIH